MGQARIRFANTVAMSMIDPKCVHGIRLDILMQLFICLPKDTVLVSVTPIEMDVGSLAYYFDVVVENDAFIDGSEITPNYSRDIYCAIDGTLQQIDSFKGIDFSKALRQHQDLREEDISEEAIEQRQAIYDNQMNELHRALEAGTCQAVNGDIEGNEG